MTKDKGTDELHALRHSLAHIMANAIQHLYPDAKFGVGPVVDNGFYYDVDLGSDSLSEDDFATLQKEMNKIISANEPFEKFEMKIDEAVEWAKKSKQPYKLELLNDLKRSGTTEIKDLDKEELGVATLGESKVEKVSFYRNGDFTDLCRGPHVESTGKVGVFRLMRVSGAYWRGKDNNPQMQRVYGVGFNNKEDLKKHLELLEEAKKRDHRRLGQELDLFVLSDLVGPGLPLFTPRGTVLRDELIKYSEELQTEGGYEAVWAPHMTRTQLYKVSGHYDKFPERFEVSSIESDDDFMLKPMNCPHVTQIYASRQRSYRDLPIRYMETTTMYRDEKSGEIHGLSRVRSLTQDDSHAFVRNDQIEDEIRQIAIMVQKMYKTLDLDLSVDLSFRDDSNAYFGDKKLWDEAESIIEKVAKELDLKYRIVKGEAAFYGPKIDVLISDALGRQWQCATIQLDFVQPERFGLEYVDAQSKKQRPAMVHKALLGSIERFLSVYIEHTAGKFPVWLAPEQLRIVTVNQETDVVDFAQKIYLQGKKLGIRLKVDDSNESVGKKIREAELMKVPYVVVVGDKELETSKLTPRVRKDLEPKEQDSSITIEQLLETILDESKSRVTKTTL